MSSEPIRSPKLKTVSATQVETFRKCQRKWWWQWVLGFKQEETRSMRLGTAFHACIEHYLKTGELVPNEEFPEVLEMVQAALDHLPPPKSEGLMVEQEISMGTYEGGPTWIGYIDLAQADALEIKGKKAPLVQDQKSRSDHRYNKTTEELAKDTQLGSYAKWVFDNSDYEFARVQHLNVNTRGKKKAVPKYIDVTRQWADDIWARDMLTVQEMQRLAELNPPVEAIPPNTNECQAYGGCAHRARCGADPVYKRDTLTKEQRLSVLERLKAAAANRTGGQASTPAAPPPAPPEEPAAAPAQATSPLLTRLMQKAASEQTSAVLPPDAPPRTSTPEEVAAANGEGPVETPEEGTVTEAGEKPKRKRRTKAEMEAARAAEAAAGISVSPSNVPSIQIQDNQITPVTVAPVAAAEPELVTSAPADVKAEGVACPTTTIFVDCVPVKGLAFKTFEDVYPMLSADAASAYNSDPDRKGGPVAHYKQIGYGQAPAYFSLATQFRAKEMPEVIYVDSRLPGADAFLSEIGPYAKLIVRGVR